MSRTTRSEYRERQQALIRQFRAAEAGVALLKPTSNLFRDRTKQSGAQLDVSGFTHVIAVKADEGWVDIEGMTTYEVAVDELLKEKVMPAVVPELKTITLGGAVSGVGIESSSFKFGLVHETVLELDILTGTGEVVTATPENKYRALFFAFPNSYGSLGYALRVRIRTVPVMLYISLTHRRFKKLSAFFDALGKAAATDINFLDGSIFSANELILTTGKFSQEAPYVSSYTGNQIYYQSVRRRKEDYLTVHDYIWRWDTDWFWQSKIFGVQQPFVRMLLPKRWLGSKQYTRLMRLNSRWGLTDTLQRWTNSERESVIQDVDIPLSNAQAFLTFFHEEIGILPIWVCPIRAASMKQYPLYPVQPGELSVNFGFWSSVPRRGHKDGYYNRLIEQKVKKLGGIKSLYSSSYFPEQDFWKIYNKRAYEAVKAQYDPDHRFKGLYEKTVGRA